jgi:hypothetical protein
MHCNAPQARLDEATDSLHESQRAEEQAKSAYEQAVNGYTKEERQIAEADLQKAVADIQETAEIPRTWCDDDCLLDVLHVDAKLPLMLTHGGPQVRASSFFAGIAVVHMLRHVVIAPRTMQPWRRSLLRSSLRPASRQVLCRDLGISSALAGWSWCCRSAKELHQ